MGPFRAFCFALVGVFASIAAAETGRPEETKGAGHQAAPLPVHLGEPAPAPPSYVPTTAPTATQARQVGSGKFLVAFGVPASAMATALVLASFDDDLWKRDERKLKLERPALLAIGIFFFAGGTSFVVGGIVNWVKGTTAVRPAPRAPPAP